MIEDRAAPHRGHDAGGQTYRQGEEDGEKRKLYGGGKSVEKLARHRLSGDDGFTQIAGKHVRDVVAVLHE